MPNVVKISKDIKRKRRDSRGEYSDNFFDFRSKNNIWDVGFPMSPRYFLLITFPIIIGLGILGTIYI